jgi:geranylgeranyl pyrophosphate synthase
MIHSASLLHDDVIDGGVLRRGNPAFWVEKGIKAAVLFGDVLVSRTVTDVHDNAPHLLPVLLQTVEEMCDAEAEQELLTPGGESAWTRCIRIARGKTGSLFALAAYACGGADEELRSALRESGYAIGTAYQLADDLLDACGDSLSAGKTLGNDATDGKTTAASAWQDGNQDPRAHIAELCESAESGLSAWPAVREAWREFVARDMEPRISRMAGSAALRACPAAGQNTKTPARSR